jgi:hypothetical protein
MPSLVDLTSQDLSSYTPVAPVTASTPPTIPATNMEPGLNTVLRCPIPPVWQSSPDSLRQFYQNNQVPQIRLFNPPPNSNVAPAASVTPATTTVTNVTKVTNTTTTVAFTLSQTDVTASRSVGVIYTATSNLFITVSGSLFLGVGHTATLKGLSNGIQVAVDTISNGSGYASISFMVPAGFTYEVVTGAIGPGDTDPIIVRSWIEWTLG